MTVIMIVEDNPINLDLAEQILEDVFEIVTAENGAVALQLLTDSRPDLVLMDLSMPVLDGWATLAQMNEDAELATIPVVALSAHAHQTVIDLALERGFDAFVTKPLDDETLLAVIEQLLKR